MRSQVSRQQRAVEGHLNGKKFKRLKAAAIAPPAASSRAGGDEDDEEDLEEEDDELDQEADEIQAFLSQGTTEFMDDGEGGEGGEGGGATAQRGAARGGPAALKKEAKRARIAERRARSVPSEMDDGPQQQLEEEEEAFWVRGAGDEVPRAARSDPVASVAGSGGKAKPKPKKKMARIG